MINCGVDHLVTEPLSPQQILSRVIAMVHHRLPFVVTADYVGPDRRKLTRPEEDYPIVDVPNSQKEKALGSWDTRRFERELENAVGSINTRKVDRQAEIIAGLADSITELAGQPIGLARITPKIERLTLLVNEWIYERQNGACTMLLSYAAPAWALLMICRPTIRHPRTRISKL